MSTLDQETSPSTEQLLPLKTYRYPGSPPFQDTELDRRLFTGRQTDADEVFHSILSVELFVLYSRSGMGKTSLLNAGVLHRLRDRGYWPASVRLNQTNLGPAQAIERQIEESVQRDPAVEIVRTPGAVPHDDPAATLWDVLGSIEVWRGDRLQPLVLILDQFEELFTLDWPEQERRRFITEFGEVVRGHRGPSDEEREFDLPAPHVKFVIVIREDALGELEALAEDVPNILQHRFRLGPLDPVQAERAIREPALVADEQLGTPPFTYSEGAARTILSFLQESERDASSVVHGEHDAPAPGVRIDPPQLQIICQHVERRVLPSKDPPGDGDVVEITEDDLGGPSGLRAVLSDFYRRTVSSLPERNRDPVRRLCENGLISASGRRLSLEQGEITDRYDVPPGVLLELVDARLLRAEPRVGSVYYELAHDTLVKPILADRDARRAASARRRSVIVLAAVAAVLIAAVVVVAWNLSSWGSDDEVDAVPLELDRALTETLEAPGDQSLFTVPPPDRVIVIEVEPIAGSTTGEPGLDAAIDLVMPWGARRTQNQLGPGGVERIVVPQNPDAGRLPPELIQQSSEPASELVNRPLQVVVSSDDGSTGSFRISASAVEVDDVDVDTDAASAEPIDIGEAGAFKVYRVAGDETLELVVEPQDLRSSTAQTADGTEQRAADAEDKREQLDVELVIIDEAGIARRVDRVGAGDAETATITPEDGMSLLVVRGYEQSTGEFVLTTSNVVRDVLPAMGTVTGEVTDAAGSVEYEFEAPEEEIAVVVVPGPDFDPLLEVVDANGASTEIDYDGAGGAEVVTVVEPGPTIIRVKGYAGSTGTFGVTTTNTRQLNEVGTIDDVPAIAVLDLPDDGDGSYEVSASPDSDSATLAIKVVDDLGFPVGPSAFFGDDRDEREPGASVSTVVFAGPFGADRIVITSDEPDGTVDVGLRAVDAQPLAPGDAVTATAVAVFELDVVGDEVLEFAATPGSDGATLDIQVVGEDGYTVGLSEFAGIAPSGAGRRATEVLTQLASRVVVTSDEPGTSIDVELTALDAQPLAPGDSVTATATAVFDLEAAGDQLLQVTATPDSDDATVDIQIIDANGYPSVASDFGTAIVTGALPGAEVSRIVTGGRFGADRIIVTSDAVGTGVAVTLSTVDVEPLAPGDAVSATTTAVFEVDVASNQLYRFTASPAADDATLDIQVLGPDNFPTGFSIFRPQPLPAELTDDVVDLFSPEVQELFADGLPASAEEAAEMLSDADLVGEVTAVFREHPEVQDVILGAPSAVAGQADSVIVGGSEWGTYRVIVTSTSPTPIEATLDELTVGQIAPGESAQSPSPAVFEPDIGAGELLTFTVSSDSPDARLNVLVSDGYGYVIDPTALGTSSEPGADVTVLVGELDTFELGPRDRQLVVVYSSDPEATITGTLDAS